MKYKKDSLYDIARFSNQYIAALKPGYHVVVDSDKSRGFYVDLLKLNRYDWHRTLEIKSYSSPRSVEQFTPATLSKKCKYKTITTK